MLNLKHWKAFKKFICKDCLFFEVSKIFFFSLITYMGISCACYFIISFIYFYKQYTKLLIYRVP